MNSTLAGRTLQKQMTEWGITGLNRTPIDLAGDIFLFQYPQIEILSVIAPLELTNQPCGIYENPEPMNGCFHHHQSEIGLFPYKWTSR